MSPLFWALAIMWMKLMKLRFARRLLSQRGRQGEESFLETRETDLVLPQAHDRARFTDVRGVRANAGLWQYRAVPGRRRLSGSFLHDAFRIGTPLRP